LPSHAPPTLFPYTTLFRSELERNRPVPGDHIGIVESVDERATGLGDELAEALERGQRVGRLEVDRAAIGPRRLDLLLAHALPHRSEEHTSELQSPYDLVCR